jgi:hypothetical protein
MKKIFVVILFIYVFSVFPSWHFRPSISEWRGYSEVSSLSPKRDAITSRPLSSSDENERRTIQFSGYQWEVKSSAGRVGPGPNYFSSSKDSVLIDEKGRLHMRLSKVDGKWYCSEIILMQTLGYGTYKFTLDGSIDNLDPRLVLGLFTWSDSPAYSHREIDIEISRWGQAKNKNAQFVIQPYTRPENIIRFDIPRGLQATTHIFTWTQDSVSCQITKKDAGQSPKGSIIQQHIFTQGIPESGDENARINLWLMGGSPPIDGKEAEVIISKFEFSPAL